MKRIISKILLGCLLFSTCSIAFASNSQVGMYEAISSYGTTIAEYQNQLNNSTDSSANATLLKSIKLFFNEESCIRVSKWCPYGTWEFYFPALLSGTATNQPVLWLCRNTEGVPLGYAVAEFEVGTGRFISLKYDSLATVDPYIRELIAEDFDDSNDDDYIPSELLEDIAPEFVLDVNGNVVVAEEQSAEGATLATEGGAEE